MAKKKDNSIMWLLLLLAGALALSRRANGNGGNGDGGGLVIAREEADFFLENLIVTPWQNNFDFIISFVLRNHIQNHPFIKFRNGIPRMVRMKFFVNGELKRDRFYSENQIDQLVEYGFVHRGDIVRLLVYHYSEELNEVLDENIILNI